MIKFAKEHNNTQFVSIAMLDSADTSEVCNHITQVFDGLSLFARCSDEILLNIPDGGCGFSLDQLREAIKPIAKANVVVITVDTDESSQRFVG